MNMMMGGKNVDGSCNFDKENDVNEKNYPWR